MKNFHQKLKKNRIKIIKAISKATKKTHENSSKVLNR